MVLYDEEYIDREKEFLREHPLSKYGLGELMNQMLKIYFTDPNVAKPRKDVPKGSLKNYKQYRKIMQELDRREREYTRKSIHDMVIR